MIERLGEFFDAAVSIWGSGGWAMWAIAVVALVMFGVGAHVHLTLREKGFRAVPESTWRHWIRHSKDRQGPIGALLDFVSGPATLAGTTERFRQLRVTETGPIERDLRMMKICVSAAPLVGLLGTVTGMLSTFEALATGSGGDKTMNLVAQGISEALITTETGLVVALPGLFFQYQLVRKLERYKAFLAHLETVYTQRLHVESRRTGRAEARRTARARVARALRSALARSANEGAAEQSNAGDADAAPGEPGPAGRSAARESVSGFRGY